MPLNGGNYAPGAYRVENYRTHVRCVVTNKGPYNAYRGYGKDLANMLIERVLDQAAERLELDPLELRSRNLLTTYPHQIVTGPIIENGSIRAALAQLAVSMDLPRLRAEQAEALRAGRHLGIALAPYIEPAGFAFPGSAFQNYESVAMRIQSDGTVRVMTGMQNIGQGIETSYAQVVADVSVEHGVFSARGIDQTLTFAELAYACYVQPGAGVVLAAADAPLLEAIGTYRHPQVNWVPDTLASTW